MSLTKTEAIKNFLDLKTHPDLAALYNRDLEVQVSVGQDGGEKVQAEFKGRQYSAYTDGLTTWKSFRIPLNANTEPVDNDGPMKYSLEQHAEGVGLTGWNWRDQVSHWVGFDFDSISGHAEGHRGKLTDEELAEVKRKAMEIPWVTVRKSTGGNGIHLYVFLDHVPTENHTEHAALARAILGQMSAFVGYDFKARVDACGWILWVWHRKMIGTDGLKLLKQGEVLKEIPPDWRDHLDVVSGRRRRTMPQVLKIEDTRSDRDRLFDELTGQQINVPLDADHERLLDFLRESRLGWSWNPDHHMLQTHTASLKKAHTALSFKGPFETVSTGRDPQDINCFCFPMRNGAWVVRRYGNGAEAATWSKDRSGYMKCYLNRDPDLAEVAKVAGAAEHKDGGFAFPKAERAVEAAAALGAKVELPADWVQRQSKLLKHKDGRLVMEVQKMPGDERLEPPGWVAGKSVWHQIFDVQAEAKASQEEVGNYDGLIRHIVTEGGEDAGWLVCSDRQWRKESKDSVKDALVHMGVKKSEVSAVVGSCIMRPWTLVKVPFGPEYVGDRMWNRNAPRLKYSPSTDLDRLAYPTWMKILNHIGKGLDDGVQQNAWCRANGVATGADWLKCWIASMFQYPTKHLPYLFLYSRAQNTGKSILGEALERIIVDGVVRAKQALMNSSGFNAELESKVLCTVEEGDLKGVRGAYEKIKEWSNSPMIQIHEKGKTPYQVINTTHWIQTSNDPDGCPIDPQDSRITMIEVSPLDPLEVIPKDDMFQLLDKEAPDFLAAVMNLEIPPTKDRLNIPIVETEQKLAAKKRNQSMLQIYLDEHTHRVNGATVLVKEFYEHFFKWLDPTAQAEWTRKKVSSEMPPEHPRGRRKDAQWCYGNLSWTPRNPDAPEMPKLVLRGEMLKPVDEARKEAGA